MSIITASKVRSMLCQGICKFEKPYHISASRIQLVFYVDRHDLLHIMSCIDGVPKNTLKISDVIGPNFYNDAVCDKIRSIIARIANRERYDVTGINLMVDLDEAGKAKVFLRKEQEKVRELADNELV